jgi:hypothetical protein
MRASVFIAAGLTAPESALSRAGFYKSSVVVHELLPKLLTTNDTFWASFSGSGVAYRWSDVLAASGQVSNR